MKSISICALVLGSFLVAAPAFAADVDGKWTGTVNTPQGEMPVAFEFKADATTLTGTALGPDGGKVPLQKGKVDGKNISFSATFDVGGMSFEFDYKGVVSPAEIQITTEFMGMVFEFVVKKS